MPVDRWSIVETRGAEGLASLEDDWRRLYAEMPNPALWHSWEAHTAYLDRLSPAPERVRWLALSDGGAVRAILPVEERMERGFGVALRVWGMPLNGNWSPNDAIGPEDDARRALLPAAVAHLRAQPDRPALLVLGPTWDGSAFWDGLGELAASTRFAFADGEEFVLPTDMAPDAFLARLPAKSRRNLRQAATRLEALQSAEYVRTVTDEELASEYRHFLELEASGWKGRRGSAVEQNAGVEGFHHELLDRLDHDGSAEIHSLHVDGHCIASTFMVRTGRQIAGLKIGYDEAYAHVSPGQLIVLKSVEWACEDPGIDLMSAAGDPPWLCHWRPVPRGLRRACVSLRPVTGRLLLAPLHVRYGPARRTARRLERWLSDHEDRSTARHGRDSG